MPDRGTVVISFKDKNTSADDVSASFNTDWIECSRYHHAVLYASTGTVTGTAPTLALKLQSSPDGVIAADIANGAMTQFGDEDNATREALAVSNIGEKIRVSGTVTGTSPVFPLTLQLVLKT